MKPRSLTSLLTAGLLAGLLSVHASAQSTTTADAAPVITAPPVDQAVLVGATANFSVTAMGSPAPVYQWLHNNWPVDGANGSTYTIANAKLVDAGTYSVRVFNRAGSIVSAAATLDVTGQAGIVSTRPQSQTINAGDNATFSVTAAGTGLTYQWWFNDRPISGATAATLTLDNVGSYRAGAYTVAVSSGGQVAEADSASLTVNSDARLTALSARGNVGTGDKVLIIGFALHGSGSKGILLRGVGPTLATQFGVSGALATPQLTLLGFGADGKTTATNSGWGGDATLAATFSAVGAFPLPSDSLDAALLETLQSGLFTARITGVNGSTGIALGELYDTQPTANSPSLIAISARGDVGAGNDVLIAGFVITGTTSESLLIRGVGPSLDTHFGMLDALAESHVTVTDSQGHTVMSDDDWNDDPDVADTCTRVGAFALDAHSHDSALLATLKPGIYTAVVSGRAGASGIALAEIYEVR